uniref:Uncharacterized protein n=1 Tax=Anopheles atroparvus TaxID=41427 RepID=A0AAG5D983_ANOAO
NYHLKQSSVFYTVPRVTKKIWCDTLIGGTAVVLQCA